MAQLSDYTLPSDVRAATGLSTTELTDLTLSSAIYVNQVVLELDDINALVDVRFREISALPAGDRTAQQIKFFNTVRIFCTYAAARQVCRAATLAVQELGDGKADFRRFSEAMQSMRDGVDEMYVSLRYRVGLMLVALEGTPVTVPTYGTALTSAVVGLAVDPVTNA